MRNVIALATASLSLICAANSARAEIGVPAAPGGLYFTLEGGYQQSDAPGVAAQGASTVVPGTVGGGGSGLGDAIGPISTGAFSSAGPSSGTGGGLGVGPGAFASARATSGTESATANSNGGGFIGADHGGYGDVSLGYVLPTPFLGILSRIEVYGDGSFADDNQSVFGAFGLRGVDNNSAIAFSAVPLNSLMGSVDQNINTWEVGFRLKADEQVGPFGIALSAEPFYINYRQYTNSSAVLPSTATAPVGAFADRMSNVDANLYGGQLAAEAVVPLFGKLSLIGRGSGGIYGLDADANFNSDFILTGGPVALGYVHDEESRMGYRLGAQAGLRYAFSSSVWLSLLGGVDYLSEVPTAILPREPTDPPAHIAFNGQVDWRVGVRLTLANF